MNFLVASPKASFQIDNLEGTYQDPLNTEFWVTENMVREWELDKDSLGLLQTGPTMIVENAVTVDCIGKNNPLYLRLNKTDLRHTHCSALSSGPFIMVKI
jgi:hypothetical protein